MHRLLLAAVALAFADSSIVVLALPDILDEFGASVSSVVWVITAYNLAVAVFAIVVVASRRLRSDPARTARIGLAVFTAASIACAAAPGLWPLVAFRAAQGAGGALVLVAALPLLGEPERAVPRWALAAAAGAVVGPAIGGALTQLFDWRAIFVAQAPVAAAALLAVRPVAEPPRLRQSPSAGRLAAQAALGLVSAALVGALFLAVVLLVNAWGYSPLAAAGIVSALPAGTLAGAPLGRRVDARTAAVLGSVLLALGLTALALLPAADPVWMAAALAFCGLGLGTALPALTSALFRGTTRPFETGGWTVAVRHLGVVLGLLLLTPLLAHDLTSGEERAKLVGTGLVLDAAVPTSTKVPLALDLARTLQRAPRGDVPDFAPQFERRIAAGGPRDTLRSLDRALVDTVRSIVTRSFRGAFLLSALLALMAAVPAVLLRRRPE